jgi:hypothetical protein
VVIGFELESRLRAAFLLAIRRGATSASGHFSHMPIVREDPLLRAKRKCPGPAAISGFDPNRASLRALKVRSPML